jgi:hypothetical protein
MYLTEWQKDNADALFGPFAGDRPTRSFQFNHALTIEITPFTAMPLKQTGPHICTQGWAQTTYSLARKTNGGGFWPPRRVSNSPSLHSSRHMAGQSALDADLRSNSAYAVAFFPISRLDRGYVPARSYEPSFPLLLEHDIFFGRVILNVNLLYRCRHVHSSSIHSVLALGGHATLLSGS